MSALVPMDVTLAGVLVGVGLGISVRNEGRISVEIGNGVSVGALLQAVQDKVLSLFLLG